MRMSLAAETAASGHKNQNHFSKAASHEKISLSAITLFFLVVDMAQVKIGSNPGSIKTASLLELESTNKGLVLPRINLVTLNSPAPLATDILTGTVVYNTNASLPGGKDVLVWKDTVWQRVTTATPVLPDADDDGVIDQFDVEPNTPAGAPVDVRGKARDTDGDGVPDFRDHELITPTTCQPVNADGVGVCNYGIALPFVDTTSNQTINGIKTFTAVVNAPSFSGNGGNLSNVVNTTAAQTIGGAKTFSASVTAPAITTPQTGTANMLPVAYGNVFSNATTVISNSSGNCTLSHPATGQYIITFTGANLSGANLGVLPVVATLFGTTPGFLTFSNGSINGVLNIYTYNSGGVLTDRGFSFSVCKP